MIVVLSLKLAGLSGIESSRFCRWLLSACCVQLSLIGSLIAFQVQLPVMSVSVPAVEPTQKWVQPIALIRDLESIEQSPLAAHWAASTRQVIGRLDQCDGLADQDCQIVFGHLQDQLEQLEFLVRQISELPETEELSQRDELMAQLSHMRYALQRRLVIWKAVHKIVNSDLYRSEDVAEQNGPNMLQVSSSKLNIENIDPVWSEYLELDKAAAAINAMNPDAVEQKKQARRALARICSPVLSVEQQNYLNDILDPHLIDLLKSCAADEVNFERLLTRIERVEYSNTAGNLHYLNDDYHNLLWSGMPQLQELAGQLQAHYRNANFRLTVSERLLNQFVPPIPDMQEPFRDRILGAHVVGQNQISNEVSIGLVPDTEQIQLRLETVGKVFSRTRAQHSGFTIHNEGSSRFQVIKRLAFGRNGIVNGKPVSSSSTSQRLTGMKSELDSIPIVGWMARKIAKQKFEQQAPNAERITKQKIESMARMRVDEQVDTYLDLMREYAYVNLLQPLVALGLEPDPIETRTTEQDLIVRYRLAGRDQMGASSARPVPLEDNLLSMQIHETAMNNLLQRIELAGQRFSIPELKSHLQDVFSLPQEDASDLEIRADAEFVFASFDPLRVDFEEGGLALTINLKSLRLGKKGKTWQNLSIRALYYPEVEQTQIVLLQDPDGVSLRGKRLRLGDQLAIRTIFTSLFDDRYEFNVLPEALAERLGDPTFKIGQFVLSDGWAGVSLVDLSESTEVADAAQRRRLRTSKNRR